MGFGLLDGWAIGNSLLEDKSKYRSSPFKNQYSIIPLFHYSMSEALTELFVAQYCQKLIENN